MHAILPERLELKMEIVKDRNSYLYTRKTRDRDINVFKRPQCSSASGLPTIAIMKWIIMDYRICYCVYQINNNCRGCGRWTLCRGGRQYRGAFPQG